MNILTKSDLDILRAKSEKAIASLLRNVDWYTNRAEKITTAAEAAPPDQVQNLASQAKKHIETAQRLRGEITDLTGYITYLEGCIESQNEALIEARAAGINEGYRLAEKEYTGYGSARSNSNAQRAREWVAEHIGGSTEGQWVNGKPKNISDYQ